VPKRPASASLPLVSGPAIGVPDTGKDAVLVDRLRAGEERAFEEVVVGLYPAMYAVARGYVGARSVAEEVVQEAWLGMLRGLDRFEGRSTLRTWVLRIVANIARDRAVREARSTPFSSLEPGDAEPAVAPDRFRAADEPYPGGWSSFPTDWRTLPESRLLAGETFAVLHSAIVELPQAQREVCETLDITPGNQRLLLHRARARVRARLERHLDG
jgi:RNA polymerase sigma-70 factor (ECF subfamily)